MRRFSVKHALILFFFLLIGLYALFEARFVIIGPYIDITSPQDGSSVEGEILVVSGTAKNVAFISLNDGPIYTDESGTWSEKLIVPPGFGIIKVEARDRYGRETEKIVRFVRKN